jgi:hypothetical protein
MRREKKNVTHALNQPDTSRSRSRASNITTISRLDYEEKVQECYKQAEQIEILQAKVRRLEHLVFLKDLRIEELSSNKSTHPSIPIIAKKNVRHVNMNITRSLSDRQNISKLYS